MQKLEIKRLILQWSRFGVVDFVKDDRWLVEILKNAQRYNIQIVIGLYGDDRYFKKLEDRDTDIESYLDILLQKSLQQAIKINLIAKKYKIFEGWYIYDEIDDTNFKEQSRQIHLKNYLQTLADSLNRINKKPLYISGYFSNHMTPKEYVDMFSNITQYRYTVLVQSGIGANLVNSKSSMRYMMAFRDSFKGEFIPIIEGFVFRDLKLEAIEYQGLREQIEILKKVNIDENMALFSLRYLFDRKLLRAFLVNS